MLHESAKRLVCGSAIFMFESLKLSDLPLKNCGLLRKPSNTRPALWVIEEDGTRAVVKDYSVNGFLFRNLMGRFLIWREALAYRRLKGLAGVPGFHRVLDGLALIIDEITGRNMEGLEKEKRLSEGFFKELKNLVDRIHQRGLAHCDLKRAPNILLGSDDRPYIVDWSTSISQREFRFFPFNLIYARFLEDDFKAIVKIQLRHCPESLTPEEKRRYYHRGRMEQLIRKTRDKLRELLQRIM
jgi:serine/threonine protein kinase